VNEHKNQPKGGTSRGSIPVGTQWEYRLTRLRFYQGQFVRRSIDLWPQGLKGDKLAELDIIAVSFDPQLRRRIEVIEGKTSASRSGEIDRVIWLRGIGTLVPANDVVIAKTRVDDRTRQLARRLRVSILDEQAVVAAERALGIQEDDWVGMHDPEFGEHIIKPLREALGKAEELSRAGKFLFGSYWFIDEFTRLKQLRTLFRLTADKLGKIDEHLIKLAVGEATVLFALAAYSVASWHDQYGPDAFNRFLMHELSSGIADVEDLRRILQRIDNLHKQDIQAVHNTYIAGGVARAIVPVRSLESDILRPPEWTEGFLDLIARLRAHPHLATAVIRTLDLRSAERLGSTRETTKVQRGWQSDIDTVTNLAETVERFLISVWRAPEPAYLLSRHASLTPLPSHETLSSQLPELPKAEPEPGL
jgi:hypothetical protein